MEYVSKDKLLEFIDKNAKKYSITVSNACNFKDFVRMCPAADVAPVAHGKWIFKERHRGGINLMTGTDAYGNEHTIKVDCRRIVSDPYCSICGQLNEAVFLNYCPNCGAKMQNE